MEKQPSPKLVTDDGMVIEVKPVQSPKHLFPKLLTDDGMVIEVKLLQNSKQSSPKLVTDDGMVIEVKLLQLEKQLSPKLVIDDGMMTELRSEQFKKLLAPSSVTGNFFPAHVMLAGITISCCVPQIRNYAPNMIQKRKESASLVKRGHSASNVTIKTYKCPLPHHAT